MEYSFLGWVVIGLLAGILAKWIMPGKDPGGLFVTMLIGVVGGLLGGFLADVLPFLSTGGDLWNLVLATLGAVILLWLYRVIKAKGA